MLLKVDALTGLLSREGFYKKARDEEERSNRYGSKFSVVVLELVFKKNMNIASREEEFNLAMAQASGIIHSSIRTTDILGRWGKNKFIILLSETDEKSACLAIKKLHISLKKHGVFYASVHAGVTQYLNGDLLTSIKEAEFRCSFSKIRRGKESHLKIVSSIGYNRTSNILKRYHMASAHKIL